MSLIYTVTKLPKLRRNEAPLIKVPEFIKLASGCLSGVSRRDFDDLVLLEDIELTIKRVSGARLADPAISSIGMHEKITKSRPESATGASIERLPHYALEPIAQHLAMRKWYENLNKKTNSCFLKNWARLSLNLEEALCGLTCKAMNVSKESFLKQLDGNFDSTAKTIAKNYNQQDLGLSNRHSWFNEVKNLIFDKNFKKSEIALNSIKWDLIAALESIEVFSADALFAYYLKLKIIEREACFDYNSGEKILNDILNLQLEEII